MEIEPKLFNAETTSLILGGLIKPSGLLDLVKKGEIPHHGGKKVFGKKIPVGFSWEDINFIMQQIHSSPAQKTPDVVEIADAYESSNPFRTTARSRALHGEKS